MLNRNNNSAINTTALAAQVSSEYCRRSQDDNFSDYVEVDNVVTLASITLNALTSPTIIVMNLLVIVAVKTRRRLQSVYNILLACLAGTDLLVGAVTIPVHIAVEGFAVSGGSVDAYCKLNKQTVVAVLFPIFASLFNLVLISAERYIALKYALRYHELVTKSRLRMTVVLSFVLSCLVSLLYTLHRNVSRDSSVARLFLSILFLFSILAIVYCHTAVYLVTRRHKKQIATEQISQEAAAKFLKEKKAWKTTGIIIGFVILSYLPTIMFLLWRLSGLNLQLALALQPFAFYIMLLNSLCNPIIYCWRCKDIRKAIIVLIRGQNHE